MGRTPILLSRRGRAPGAVCPRTPEDIGIKAKAGGVGALALALLGAGPAQAVSLVCHTPPGVGAAFAAPHTARIADPWGDAPVLSGADEPVAVVRYNRARTIIFDARNEFLYVDRDNHMFTYSLWQGGRTVQWHGRCRVEP